MRILLKILILVMLTVANEATATKVLCVRDTTGLFSAYELKDGTTVEHYCDSAGVLMMRMTLASSRKIEMPAETLDSCEIVDTDIPSISIRVPGNADIEHVSSKNDYLDAILEINGSGKVPDQDSIAVKVKGRGNTTWSFGKKPMRLKFASKTSICGFEKAKNYVLLANYIDETHCRNSVAFWIGKELGVPYTSDFQPCDVFFNDRYVGLYLLTEKTGIGATSVDLSESKGVLIELSQEYDEKYRFKSEKYGLPVMIKDPDFDELFDDEPDGPMPEDRLDLWKRDFAEAEDLIYGDRQLEAVGIESCSNYLMVFEICANNELGHPKSCFMFKDRSGLDYKYRFGPIWDFDFSMNKKSVLAGGKLISASPTATVWRHDFFEKISSNEHFKKYYRERMEKFCNEIYPRLEDFLEEYAQQIRTSALLDGARWPAEPIDKSITETLWSCHVSSADFDSQIMNLREWLGNRVEYLREKYE